MLLILTYILIGAIAGTLSGLLGIGGGLIVVPSLAYMFARQHFNPAIIMHMAVATSLSIMIITSSRSLLLHYKRKIKFWAIYRRLVVGVIIGTIVGVVLAHFLHSNVLRIIFGVFVALMAIRMLFGHKAKRSQHFPSTIVMNCVSFIIGAKSGLLGLGGGVVTVPFLLYCNVGMREAVITSIATSLTIAVIGTIAVLITGSYAHGLPSWTTGYIYWPATLTVAIGSVLFAPLGVKLSHWLPTQILKRVFGIVLVLIAIHMLW